LELYLKHEARRRRPAALAGLGQALLGQAQYQRGLLVLRECADLYPRDPAVFQARLLGASAYAELGEYPPARELLLANLEGDDLTPASHEWRDSLFALGKVAYLAGELPEAVLRLEEAIERYPDAAQTLDARYLVAQAYAQQAESLSAPAGDAASEAQRLERAQQAKALRESALAAFDRALVAASSSERSGGLASLVERNCRLKRASMLYHLGRYDAALEAWSTTANLYQASPVALEALVRMADCYRRLQRLAERRATLQRARLVLERLPEDAPFAEVTNFSRLQWAGLLDQMASL
jgi:tetratricopeptide (TPR) repeat protein